MHAEYFLKIFRGKPSMTGPEIVNEHAAKNFTPASLPRKKSVNKNHDFIVRN